LIHSSASYEPLEANVLDQLLVPQIWSDPYPFYATLREHPVIRHVGSMPGLVFTRHADVSELLRDPRFSNQFQLKYDRARTLSDEEEQIQARVLAFLSGGWMQADEHFHAIVRDNLTSVFSRSRVAKIADRIHTTCSHLLTFVAPPSMDFMIDFTQPLLSQVLGDVFGVPAEVCIQVGRCSTTIATFLGTTDPKREDMEHVDREMRELTEALTPIVKQRRLYPEDDVITALSHLRGKELSVEETAAQCSLTLAAGLETTAGLLGNSMLAFLKHPVSLNLVRGDPSLLAEAVEECLRYDSSSQWVPRVARQDLVVNGVSVRRHELVWLGLGAANRDPQHFPFPDQFEIARKQRGLVSFGGGVHYCLGAHLARLEANIALETIFKKLDQIQLEAEDVPYMSNFGIRSPQSLRIRFRQSSL
jgi:cytochrome P450